MINFKNIVKIVNKHGKLSIGRGRKTVNIPDTFVSNGKVLSGAVEISEGFNIYFANIGPDLAKTIKGNNFLTFCHRERQKTLFLQI